MTKAWCPVITSQITGHSNSQYLVCHQFIVWWGEAMQEHPVSWCHQMETFSTLLAICVGNSPIPGELPAQRPVTRSFDVFFDLHPNKQLSKQWWGWWFETPPCPLWCHCNDKMTFKCCIVQTITFKKCLIVMGSIITEFVNTQKVNLRY